MGNMSESTKSYYYDNDFRNYFECLGDEGREKFLEWLSSLKRYGGTRNNAVNYDFCVSYENDLYKCGVTMVYVYTSEIGIPFYVGKGTTDRATNIYNRSGAFMDRIREGDTCRIFALACDIRDECALEIETLVINEILDRGWRLTNDQKVAISKEQKRQLLDEYPEIIEAVNHINSSAVSYLLEERDTFGDKGRVCVANKSRMKAAN